ncbi:MAG: hypothetical protein IPO04_12340 [Cytophagaceae bacterium]|nr:hypothetical protein [Cytophagaceae bacterium]
MNEGEVMYYTGSASTPGFTGDVNLANDIKSGAIVTSNNDFGVDVVLEESTIMAPEIWLFFQVIIMVMHTSLQHILLLSTAPVYAFFTNNLATPITIDWTSGTGATGSFVVAGKSNNYLDLNQNAGYRFKSRNGEAYTAVAVFDADATGLQYDWSFNMIPESRLSTFASVAWAPGSSNGTANYNPVWVTAPTATTLYIKFDGNLAIPNSHLEPLGFHMI